MFLSTYIFISSFALVSFAQEPLKVILHFDYGSMSHIKPLLEVGSVLRARNHTVIYASSEENENYNVPYGFRYLSLGKSKNDPSLVRKRMKEFQGSKQSVGGGMVFKSLSVTLPTSYETVYPRLSQVVDQEKPDVIMCDFFSSACRDVALMKGVPLVSSFQSIDGFGIAPSPFVTDAMAYGSITTDNLDFFHRLWDKVYVQLNFKYNSYTLVKELNKRRDMFNVPHDSTPFGDFSLNLGLANTFLGFEAATPLPPNIRMIGPLRSETHSDLPQPISSFLESHPRTVYIAFGSRVVLSASEINTLLQGSLAALNEGSIDGVVWGLGRTIKDDFPDSIGLNGTDFTRDQLLGNAHPNLRLLPWAPQSAILGHKNTRLFISHGGLESAFEAIFSMTPILCMPFFGDQPRNARKIEDAGIGLHQDRLAATPSSLASKMSLLLQDKDGKIKVNVRRMKTLATVGSRRKVLGADAIEEYAYAARICRPLLPHQHGQVPCEAKHIIPASRNMSFFKANLLDVYLFAFGTLLTVASMAIYGLLRFFSSAPQSPQKAKKQ